MIKWFTKSCYWTKYQARSYFSEKIAEIEVADTFRTSKENQLPEINTVYDFGTPL